MKCDNRCEDIQDVEVPDEVLIIKLADTAYVTLSCAGVVV